MKKSTSISSKDVAREAGVSQATVSYVLNNTSGVKIKPETRELVIATAKKLNYHPNLIARSMRLKRSTSIGIVSDKNVSNFNFMKTLEGIKDALIPKNYSLTLCFDRSTEIETAEHIRYYNSNRIDGIIFVFADLPLEHYAYLTEHSIPFVVIHSNAKEDMLNLVKTDMNDAIRQAIGSFHQKGISEIAYWGTKAGDLSDRRFSGYCKALDHFGLPLHQELALKAPDNEDEWEASFQAHIEKLARLPRAVLCETNGIGFRLLRYAAKRGIRIPEDIAVIAIGTTKFAPIAYPALSAIESPLYDMGFTGCEMLFDIMNGNPAQNMVVLEWSLVERETN